MTSRCFATHDNPNGRGDSRPTALQIIKGEEVEDALAGKVIVGLEC
jgi:hypothetical protein